MARCRYENFPVASLLLPAHLRAPVNAIYAFARSADDVADEGNQSPALRLQKLGDMEQSLRASIQGSPPDEPLYLALSDTFRHHNLPPQPLYDLLRAFRQDVTVHRYRSYADVMNYCRYSANPVGRLLLHLYRQASENRIRLSDAICSALQWINILQDIGEDYRKNQRIYLPGEELQQFGVSELDIACQKNSPRMQALFKFQIERTASLLASGSELGTMLPGRFGLEVRLVLLAGARVLQKLASQTNVFGRPRLGGLDKACVTWSALRRATI
jgi:squalene synthase HpnC